MAFVKLLKSQFLLFLTIVLMIVTSCIVRPSFHAINFQVIFLLFDLMLITSVFEKRGVLKAIAVSIVKEFNTQRKVSVVMILLTSVFAMFLTNDVALIVIVPLTIVIYKNIDKNPIKLIVLEALAANIGGNFSPLGSPQNMYIFLKYNVHILTFLSITVLFSVIGVYWLIITALKFEKQTIIGVVENVKVEKMGQITFYFFLFVLTVIFLIFHINLIWITIVIVFVTLERSRESFKHVDYALLIIFVGFFIIFDNLSRMSIFLMLTHLGKNPFMVYIMAAFLSQVMSNVPSTIFLSKFTLLYKPLLLGASVGGAGTLIASLANLIAYRLYRGSYKKEKFFPYFNKMNWTLFGILFCVNGVLLLVVFIR